MIHRLIRSRVFQTSVAVTLLICAAIILAGNLGFISPRYAFWARNPHIDFEAAQARLDALSGRPIDTAKTRVVIHKARRELELWCGDRLLKTCKIALGSKATGAKSAKGDGRTPEGDYFICSELDRSRFHLFLGLSYPNAADAARAFDAGIIKRAELDACAADEANRRQPEWSTAMGGAIGIHGGGTFHDWTLGCIAVSNEDIEEVWLAVRHGTQVTIHP